MFKLVRIVNSGSNVAEPIRIPPSPTKSYYIGAAGCYSSVGTPTPCAATDKPLFIFGEAAERRSGKGVVGYPVSRHMIFAVSCSEDPSSLKVGDHVTFSNLGTQISADSASGGCVEIYDTAGAKAVGDTVYVKFDI